VAAQALLWLLALAVALRMRFGAGERPPSRLAGRRSAEPSPSGAPTGPSAPAVPSVPAVPETVGGPAPQGAPGRSEELAPVGAPTPVGGPARPSPEVPAGAKPREPSMPVAVGVLDRPDADRGAAHATG